VRLLVIGGTQFVGRAFVESATQQRHAVTVFHRGVREPADLPDVEHVHGDRDGELDRLAGGEWDAALDTCAYFPRAVRDAAAVLRDAIGHYTLISSLSVHPDDLPVGADESTPTHEPPYPDTEEITAETYGPLKVACEHEAERSFPGRCLVVRPGYIVGPHDPTDRFTYWVRRAADGGEMLAPGPPEAGFQVVDVRDLAAFLIDRMEAADADVYGVVGPAEPINMRDVLETARTASGVDTTFRWVDEGFLHALGPETGQWLPMWHPELPGFHAYDARKAVAAGLRHRPFADTVADTLAWDDERGRPPLRAGLPAGKERELLDAWRSRD
jgi:2'-hydroxyisoflavone reductase